MEYTRSDGGADNISHE